MKEKDGGYAIAIHPGKSCILPLGKNDQPDDKYPEQDQHHRGPDKTVLLSYGTENKVRLLFRHIFQLCLRPVQETFPGQSARPDSDLRLVHVVTGTARIIFQSQRNFDTDLLMGFQYLIESTEYMKAIDPKAKAAISA